mmetsp:Transcript_5722/g.6790  ORF Transcript_5722/g.6790 Transcript_5722/m.6790 type:complete len:185 (-) Transcript_5722:1418-1972(-)
MEKELFDEDRAIKKEYIKVTYACCIFHTEFHIKIIFSHLMQTIVEEPLVIAIEARNTDIIKELLKRDRIGFTATILESLKAYFHDCSIPEDQALDIVEMCLLHPGFKIDVLQTQDSLKELVAFGKNVLKDDRRFLEVCFDAVVMENNEVESDYSKVLIYDPRILWRRGKKEEAVQILLNDSRYE